MNKKELDFILQEGEGYNVEFKESLSDTLAKDICAFANANGGKILLGVDDNGNIKRLKVSNKIRSQIYDITRNADPAIKILLEKMGDVLVIIVPEGTNKPYSINGKFYIRYGPNSQQLSRNEIREFFQKEGLVLFDEKPNKDFNLSKDFSKEAFGEFLKESKSSRVLKEKDVLKNLSLLKDEKLKNAGVLLFSKKITDFFSSATIICTLFQGKTKYQILDTKEFDRDIYSNFRDALTYIQSKLNTKYIIKGGPREEMLELPLEALREGLLNAIAHRDYVPNASIQVHIFADRLEIINPGGLVKGMTKEDLGKKSLSRNNLLFGLMQRMHLVEKVGSGILRMKAAMKNYGLNAPKFDINDNWFSIIFDRPSEVSEKMPEKMPEKILYLISKNNKITIQSLTEKLSADSRTIERNIAKLKQKGLLKRIGPAKGGHWQVKK